MRRVLAAGVLSLAVLAAVAPAAAQSGASESEVDASQVCSEHHKFGAQPVDVAKTSDGAIVLAQIAWNWHDSIGCYLTLDEAATAVLREALPPTSLPGGKTAASQLCSGHHEFGVNPVDVAKAADGAVLAWLVWNWHDEIGCYLTLDAEALETLQVAHAAANAPEATPDPSAPHGEGEPITGGPTFIGVPAAEPSGRCASALSSGVYEWEQCAWAEYWEDSDYNYSLSDEQAATLIARIWAEVDVDGKAVTPPTNALIPAGSLCATATGGGFIIGCYQPSIHHIRRLDSFLETLLHEAAHALVANHASIQPCRSLTDSDEYQACVHNDIFRCTANHLYMEYADLPDAGVCGTALDRESTGFQPTRWTSSIEEGDRHAWVDADWHTRPSPYEDSKVSLVVRCQNDGTLDVYFWFDEGRIEGLNGRVSAAHIFLPEGFSEWGSERQQEYVAANRVDVEWHESTTSQAAFLPGRLHEDFLNDAVKNDAVLIRAWDHDNSDLGLMAFSLEDAYRHIRPVTEECGWTWS